MLQCSCILQQALYKLQLISSPKSPISWSKWGSMGGVGSRPNVGGRNGVSGGGWHAQGLDLPFFAKFFAKNLFTFFAFFAKKRGAKKAKNAKKIKIKICHIFGNFGPILCFFHQNARFQGQGIDSWYYKNFQVLLGLSLRG